MTKSIAKELGDQVELGFRLCEDRPKGKFALKCDQVGQNGFMGGFVEQNVGWLIVFGDTDGRMPRELRITFLPVSSADVEGGGILGFVEDRQPNRCQFVRPGFTGQNCRLSEVGIAYGFRD